VDLLTILPGEEGENMNEVIRKILIVGVALIVPISFLLMAGCNAVKETPQTQTIYTESGTYGQVPASTIQDLKEQYPEGFYNEKEKTIAVDEKISIGIAPFKGAGTLAQTAEQGTDIFSTTIFQSGLFLVVEREELDRLVAEVELNQSGLVSPAKSLEVGKMTSMQLLLSGNLSDAGGRQRIDIKVVDVRSGEVILAEKMGGQIDADSIGFLARQVVKKLAKRYYSE
jgi:curli biogenesis system outer membrane secretion channel CsgG